ncbi:MAG: thioredoxin domain-containing protein [bacterium]
MQNQPAKNGRYYIYAVVLGLMGLFISVELLVIHLTVSEDPFHPFSCHVAPEVDCNAVALSRESMLLSVPVPVWAILTYVAFLALAAAGIKSKQPFFSRAGDYALALAAWTVAYSGYLAWVSAFRIETFCAYCTALYFVNLGLLFATIPTARPLNKWMQRRAEDWRLLYANKVILSAAAAAVVIAGGGLAAFNLLAGRPAELKLVKGVNIDLSEDPATGPFRAPVTVIEWSDYECPHCNRMHQRVEDLLKKFRGKIRHVHKSYPLNPKCNPYVSRPQHLHACEAAKAAECAFQMGHYKSYIRKLWDIAAVKGALDTPTLLRLAEEEGMDPVKFQSCMESSSTRAAIKKDVQDAKRAGINATPSFIVNGYKFTGGRDLEWCSKLIERFLKGKKPPRAEKIAEP